MKQLFPLPHVMGFVFSLILSLVALAVVYFDLSYTAGMTILLITAIVQASLQLLLFMHIGENSDRSTLYTNIAYALFVGVVTILGTLFTMVWGYN
ncbi:cytochrome aa3 quinol oxidase subunit IV [Bacillus badius]|uniref:Quinol oxidase subunit 4 n=1 Tax=Bacillus badius TaxID=1455 RepID=A0ABR5AXG7_BACBA|nr:cytochrome aa3 quinol oxidase subunit IV [Bacillus badius]KIL74417.1 quinol oxidase polypeptide IV QoxD [Bacillus badius]KIL78888.1 quinol oxidase polypeptide IV QoxD [Bacillus badius]KZN99671.1 cytochrome aa3 quinol oxidase subunit IV [Bacillus badius]KZR58915.1 cytochrome aa3 quinol oxidase subunit IV [Bacillus badius]MED0665798.1 cytochrome aa3 quinol oxidase subunit IV [Bacillus badius]